jgi:hypothetical protein
MSKQFSIYGLMAEFDTPQDLLAASRRAHAEGYRRMDAYAPFPVEGLAEAIGFHHTRLPLLVLLAGLFGALVGFASQNYVTVFVCPDSVPTARSSPTPRDSRTKRA